MSIPVRREHRISVEMMSWWSAGNEGRRFNSWPCGRDSWTVTSYGKPGSWTSCGRAAIRSVPALVTWSGSLGTSFPSEGETEIETFCPGCDCGFVCGRPVPVPAGLPCSSQPSLWLHRSSYHPTPSHSPQHLWDLPFQRTRSRGDVWQPKHSKPCQFCWKHPLDRTCLSPPSTRRRRPCSPGSIRGGPYSDYIETEVLSELDDWETWVRGAEFWSWEVLSC